MGRKNKSVNRPILPDSRYNSSVVSKFVTRMMLDGKKSISVRIMYEAMDTLKSKTEKNVPKHRAKSCPMRKTKRALLF